MVTLFLVRHASHGLLGKTLAGRMPGISLSPEGRVEAERLAARLGREAIDQVLTSPLERARETAAPIAARLNCPVVVADEINEIDCGEWTGQSFERLAADPRWRVWNEARAAASAPGGEAMRSVQARAMGLVRRLSAGDGAVAMVSHSDVIKAIVAAILGLSLDRHDNFSIDPASITTVHMFGEIGRIAQMNETVPA